MSALLTLALVAVGSFVVGLVTGILFATHMALRTLERKMQGHRIVEDSP